MCEALCPCDFDLPDDDGFPFRLVHDREVRDILRHVHPQAMITCMFDCNHAAGLLETAHKLDGTNNRVSKVLRPRGCLSRSRDPSTWAENRARSRPRFLPALPFNKQIPPVPPAPQ